jgi:ABC-type phosphate/phosphonate transport system permease subunit
MDLESYMTQKDLNLQKGDLLLKIMQTISILFAAAVLAGLIVIINAFS